MKELGNTPADKNYKPSGISRAEEAALKAYPPIQTNCDGEILHPGYDKHTRDIYQEGYEQAEKDLALTWDDVQIIWMETEQYMKELRRIERTDLSKFPSSSREIFEEILRRYKEVKK